MKSKICYLLAILLLLTLWNVCLAQEFHGSFSAPTYQGGIDSLKAFIENNISYTKGIKPGNDKIVISVTCTVNEKGQPEKTKILRGINPAIDAEAIRVVNLINWNPAIQWEKRVKAKVVIPVEFKIKSEAAEDSSIEIKGKVLDKLTGNPIEGSLVLVKGTTAGAITDAGGNYNISVSSEDTRLEFSSIGYGDKTETIGRNRLINAELQAEDIVIEFNK